MNEPEKLIPLHGGCRHLKSFQVAQEKQKLKFGKRTADANFTNLCELLSWPARKSYR